VFCCVSWRSKFPILLSGPLSPLGVYIYISVACYNDFTGVMAGSVPHSRSSDTTTFGASIQLSEDINAFLHQRGIIPTENDSTLYETAFTKLSKILLGEEIHAIRSGVGPVAFNSSDWGVSLFIASIGSYALNIWDCTSDIDCLCVGTCSSNTFYSMARQRLRREADQGIRILSADKSGSGSMLEIEIQGVKLNLQYCQSSFAEP